MISDLADELCDPVGGFLNKSNTTASPTVGAPTAAVSAFEGGAGRASVGWGVLGIMGLGLWVLLEL